MKKDTLPLFLTNILHLDECLRQGNVKKLGYSRCFYCVLVADNARTEIWRQATRACADRTIKRCFDGIKLVKKLYFKSFMVISIRFLNFNPNSNNIYKKQAVYLRNFLFK